MATEKAQEGAAHSPLADSGYHSQIADDQQNGRSYLASPEGGNDGFEKYDGPFNQASTASASTTDEADDGEATRRSWFRMRPADDDEPQDWWFASTAIPLLAATLGPLANVLSIASIVGQWRVEIDPNIPGTETTLNPVPDPRWEITINAVSLVCGFIGNLFLLFNFTRAVRYIIALPVTIILWYLATGLLIGTLSRMAIYEYPSGENEIWGQPFWYAVMAAILYMVAAMLLMINMLGYFLGHYTQHFELTDEQRNLILQTMMFFAWLAGGGGVFAKVSGWSYSDSLYFCDVTILTVGFGDFAANNDLGRGLIFPYSVGGIIMLGLVISSISKFAAQIGHTKIVHKRIEERRARTVERAVTTSFEARERYETIKSRSQGCKPQISAPFDLQKRTIAFNTNSFNSDRDLEKGLSDSTNSRDRASTTEGDDDDYDPLARPAGSKSADRRNGKGLKRTGTVLSTISENLPKAPNFLQVRPSRRSKLVILKEERDRFNAMRKIQNDTKRFKRYFALTMSVVAFGVLWCVGAVVFWQAEHSTQNLSYFQALYFCYVSLLTIGYGDLSPKSNAGKPFFVVWSLIAVPTMTILVSDLGNTVIAAYKRGTFKLADWSIMPKQGVVAAFLKNHPKMAAIIEQWQTNRRIKKGFDVGPEMVSRRQASTIEQLVAESNLDEHDMAKRLAKAIRRTADDLKTGIKRHYTYEEWVEFTRLIRFTRHPDNPEGREGADHLPSSSDYGLSRYGEEDGVIEWDWIGENSPMMADQHECEWVLDRLCESLNRYMHKMVPEHVKERRRSQADRRRSLMEGRRSFAGKGRGKSVSKSGTERRNSSVSKNSSEVLRSRQSEDGKTSQDGSGERGGNNVVTPGPV